VAGATLALASATATALRSPFVSVRRLALGLLVVGILVAGGLAYVRSDRPALARWAHLDLAPTPAGAEGGVWATFLGVSTVLVTDGETALMTDGFFTRPSLAATLFGRVVPDPERIGAALTRAGVTRLAAVIVVHSHYDHVMDAPEVARRTGALLVGSESTANVARGWGLPEASIRVVRPGEPMRFGGFEVTLLRSRHFPHGMAMGEITTPLVPPARATAYREGGSYSVLIGHAGGSLLVQGSAGWVEGALHGRRADVVLLGVAGLGSKDETYRATYFREVVEAVAPRLVIPIHWDDFTLPLDQPLLPMPRILDDLDTTLTFLTREIQAHPPMRLALPRLWEPFPLSAAR
jgi:L-ascorbate metabolism protein UlaG (beta-lactamase superfamily)